MGEYRNYMLSRYNIVFERENEHFLWNTLTNAFFRLDADGVAYLRNFSSDDHPYFSLLLKNGCIVDTRYNELGKVLTDEKVTMLNPLPRILRLTIAPGMDCNYKCHYCFEGTRISGKKMSLQTQNEVCAYIEKLAEENCNLQQIGVTWFGGEPLLYVDVISQLSKFLINYCKQKGLNYSAGIVTNGRYLTEENAKILRQCCVGYVQISIDGTCEHYCVQKGASVEDFKAVVQNVKTTVKYIPVTIRINVSDNISDAIELTNFLLNTNELDGKIKIYIAQIRKYEDSCIQKAKTQHSRFLEYQREYMKLFGKDGLYSAKSLALINTKRRHTTCHSICSSNFCIGPEGEFYRCEHMYGNSEQIVGTVRSGRFYTDNELSYIQFQHLDKCQVCTVFPVCMGGCMNDAVCGETALSCMEYINFLGLV